MTNPFDKIRWWDLWKMGGKWGIQEVKTGGGWLRLVVSARNGELVTEGISQAIEKLLATPIARGIMAEPIRLDSIITIFRTPEEIRQFIETSRRQFGFWSIFSNEKNTFAITISSSISNPPEILAIAVLPERESIINALKTIESTIPFQASETVQASIQKLRDMYHDFL
jgi:hypothetical protein